MNGGTFRTTTLAELADTRGTSLIRKHFDITAFGVNAFTGPEEGASVVERHDELGSGHEELYVVTSGRARFTIEGDELEADAGALIFVRDPAVTREAAALEPWTTVLAIGGSPGAFEPRGWETSGEAVALFERGEYAEARRLLAGALLEYHGDSNVLYNLACAEARLGESQAALDHLEQALQARPALAGPAREDEDFTSLHGDERFETLTREA